MKIQWAKKAVRSVKELQQGDLTFVASITSEINNLLSQGAFGPPSYAKKILITRVFPSSLGMVTISYKAWRSNGRKDYSSIVLRLEAFLDDGQKRTFSPLLCPATARAEKLLYLVLSPKDSERLIGDLAEEFQEIAKKHGERFAVRWYWWQTLASIVPIISRRLTKLAKKTALMGGLAKAYDWFKQWVSS